jgi:ferredoxin
MKVSVNSKACNGCTICNITCPEVFLINDDGKAEPRMITIPKNIEEICIEAADECPANAISIEEFSYHSPRVPVFAKMGE